jgi:TolB protein
MTKGRDGIWLVNAIGGKARQLTKTPENAGDSRLRWSPNGRQIAFVRYTSGNPGTYDLWVMQADGTEQHLLVANAYTSAWSPDGRQLAISRPTGQTKTGCGCLVTDLYLSDGNGTNPRLLVRNGGSATWSPDGKQIVFTRWQGARTHLWMINTDGTGLRQLTHGPKSQGSAAWKPSPH